MNDWVRDMAYWFPIKTKAKVVRDLYQRRGICIWWWNDCCFLGRAKLLNDLSCTGDCCLWSSYVSVFLGNSPLGGELFLNHVEWEDVCSLAGISGGKECTSFLLSFITFCQLYTALLSWVKPHLHFKDCVQKSHLRSCGVTDYTL